MGILRDIMCILRNFTGAKLRVLNYGFCLTITCFFGGDYGYFYENYGYFTDYANYGSKRQKTNKIQQNLT